MTLKLIPALALLTLAVVPAANAVEASLTITLGTDASADVERRSQTYECTTGEPFSVVYLNASPNFLALVPLPDETERLVFTSVIAASGVRYVSGKWAWWTKGPEASLYDLTLGEDAEPVNTCTELNNAP